jgi:hypothetical protein
VGGGEGDPVAAAGGLHGQLAVGACQRLCVSA